MPKDAPLGIATTAISSTKVKVEWQPPTTPNGMTTAYLIQYHVEDSQSRRNSSEFTNTSGVVEDLEFYTSYCFQVSARTSASGPSGAGPRGPFSSEQCVRTKEDSKKGLIELW